jgi:hypothetical protein
MRAVSYLIALTWLTLSGCESEVISQTTTEFAVGERVAELTDERLDEASGLVASRSNPGQLWILNDGGNEAELYLVDKDLRVNLTVRLHDVVNRDWEDIAIGAGPDPAKTYIYVGDIGDNLGVFSHKHIYRFPEPKLGNEESITISDFDKITFDLEDNGMKDFESLLIDPKSKKLYIISKREFPASVYELPYTASANDTITASKVLTLPMISLVAADCFEKNGDILMKNYTNVYYWKNKDNLDVVSLLKLTPQGIPYESEPQGESIGWAADGSGFFTLSEKPEGQSSYLYFYSRK